MNNTVLQFNVTEQDLELLVDHLIADNVGGIGELEERATAEEIAKKFLLSQFQEIFEDADLEAAQSSSFYNRLVSVALIAEENARWEDLNQRQPLAA